MQLSHFTFRRHFKIKINLFAYDHQLSNISTPFNKLQSLCLHTQQSHAQKFHEFKSINSKILTILSARQIKEEHQSKEHLF